jgi:hypothetical protein
MRGILMHLNAAIALQGLSDHAVDDVVERIRYLLQQIEPDIAYVGVEVRSFGSEFGMLPSIETFNTLLLHAEQRRREILNQFWRDRCQDTLLTALRLGHAITTMNPTRIRLAMDLSMKDGL